MLPLRETLPEEQLISTLCHRHFSDHGFHSISPLRLYACLLSRSSVVSMRLYLSQDCRLLKLQAS